MWTPVGRVAAHWQRRQSAIDPGACLEFACQDRAARACAHAGWSAAMSITSGAGAGAGAGTSEDNTCCDLLGPGDSGHGRMEARTAAKAARHKQWLDRDAELLRDALSAYSRFVGDAGCDSGCEGGLLSSATPRIPRVVHHIWLGSPMPAKFRRLRQSFAACHSPAWKHVRSACAAATGSMYACVSRRVCMCVHVGAGAVDGRACGTVAAVQPGRV